MKETKIWPQKRNINSYETAMFLVKITVLFWSHKLNFGSDMTGVLGKEYEH